MEVAPFFVDFHHFLSIFTIFYRFSRFTHFCRDLHFVAIYALFPQIFFGQNSLLRNITRFLHVCLTPDEVLLFCLWNVMFLWQMYPRTTFCGFGSTTATCSPSHGRRRLPWPRPSRGSWCRSPTTLLVENTTKLYPGPMIQSRPCRP